jgi:tetratricopeptide (TPR) repeat protein
MGFRFSGNSGAGFPASGLPRFDVFGKAEEIPLRLMSRKDDHAFEISFYESVLRHEPDYTDVMELLGGLYTKVGRIADGLEMDRRLVQLLPDNATAHYNLACSLALSARKPDALRALARAIELGYDDRRWMRKDPDLAEFRGDPEFERLLAKIGGKK